MIQGEDLTTSDAPAIGADVDSEHLLVDACQFPPVSVDANMGGSCFDPYTSPASLDADIDGELLAQAIADSLATARGHNHGEDCDRGASSSSGPMALSTVHSSSLPGASASGHEGAIDCGAASPSQRASVQVPFSCRGTYKTNCISFSAQSRCARGRILIRASSAAFDP